MQPLLHPSGSLSFDLKDPEIDVTDAQSNRLIVYTDGRQLQKATYNNRSEIAGPLERLRAGLGGKKSAGRENEQDVRIISGRPQVL